MSGALSGFPELNAQAPQAPNLLGYGQSAAGLIGQMNQNKQFAAQQAQSQLLTKNTNPDGSVNVPAYQAAVAGNPQAASVGAADAYAQAQDLNAKLLANTGQSLTQHYTRLTTAADMIDALNTQSNGKGIQPGDYKNAILTALNDKIIQPAEAASLYTGVSDDPLQNARSVQQLDSGLHQSLAMITPAYQILNTGTGTVTAQTNANAPGGASVPNTTTGVGASALAAPYQWTDQNNQPHNGTVGEYLASQGINTQAMVGGGVGGASTVPQPTAPGGPQPPLPVIAAPSSPAASASPAGQSLPSAPGAPPAPGAPGTGGAPQLGPAPGLADVQAQNTSAYNADVQGGTSIAPRVSALQELAAAAPDAQTGPAASQLANLRGLAAQFGMNVGTDQASQEQVMNKATNLLVTSGLSGLGTPTDSKMLEVMGATPNSTMTPDAVKSTVAMTYGTLQYQQNLAKAAQQWVTNGGSPTQYNQFKLHYQQMAPSPLVLAMPYMPSGALLSVGKYIKTLPPSDQKQIDSQIGMMNQANAPSQ